MKLFIRADMNDYIATGHVMRCVSIAKVAINAGIEVKFVSADENGRRLVEKYGIEYVCLESKWNELNNELQKLVSIIRENKADWILVDSYYVTEEYLNTVYRECHVAYIDDLNAFFYPCHMLICYANYYKKFHYEKRYLDNTRLLLGCNYAPLRECFSGVEYKNVSKMVNEVLILSGGTDRFHFIRNFLKLCDDCNEKLEKIHITAVCGMYNEDYGVLNEMYCNTKNVTVVQSLSDIETYMQRADLAISAGGTTLYELCACGTPTICYTFADNQLDNAMSFACDGIMEYAGDLRNSGAIDKVFEKFLFFIRSYEKRVNMSKKMRMLVDGNGTVRIVEELKKKM